MYSQYDTRLFRSRFAISVLFARSAGNSCKIGVGDAGADLLPSASSLGVGVIAKAEKLDGPSSESERGGAFENRLKGNNVLARRGSRFFVGKDKSAASLKETAWGGAV